MDMKSKIRKLFVEKETLFEDAFNDEIAHMRKEVDGAGLSGATKARIVSRLNAAEIKWKSGETEEAEKLVASANTLLGTNVKGVKTPVEALAAPYVEIMKREERVMNDLGPAPTRARNRVDSKLIDIANRITNLNSTIEGIHQEEDRVKNALNKIDAREGTKNLNRFMYDSLELDTHIQDIREKWENMKTRALPSKAVDKFFDEVHHVSDNLAKRFGDQFYKVKKAPPNALTGEIWNYSKSTPSDQAVSGMAAANASKPLGNELGNDEPIVVDLDGDILGGNAKKNSVV